MNDTNETFLHVALNSVRVTKKKAIEFIKKVKNEFITEILKDKRVQSIQESILHIIAYNDYHEMVQKFHTCYDMINKQNPMVCYELINKKDPNGDQAIHVAAKQKKFRTLFEIIDKFDKKIDLNAQNWEGETVLHIVIKQGNPDVVSELIREGSDLKVQDLTGNTPLHDLVECAAETKYIMPFIQVWQTVVKEAVFWWCKLGKVDKQQFPPRSSSDFKRFQEDAVFYLRSDIRNKKGFTVLQYAALKGLSSLVRAMIWVEDIFVCPTDFIDGQATRVEVNVTNLMPHVAVGKIEYLNESQKFKDVKHKAIERQESCCTALRRNCCDKYPDEFHEIGDLDFNEEDDTLLDAFLKIRPSNVASEVMAIEPLNRMVKDYWFVHQWCMVLMLVFHIVHMAYYTNYSLATLSALNISDSNQLILGSQVPNMKRADYWWVFLLWPVQMVIPRVATVLFVLRNLCCICIKGDKYKARGLAIIRQNDTMQLLQNIFELESYVDLKDFFKLPIFFISIIASLLPSFLPWCFCCLTLCSFLVGGERAYALTYIIIATMLVGWLMTFYWASSFEPVYRFLTALYHIILKDIISFVIFYVFVLISFAAAMYALFQTVPDLQVQFHNLNDVMYELLLLGCTAESRISSGEISKILKSTGHSLFFFQFIFGSYIIAIMVLYLNLIIASMVGTYHQLANTEQNGWQKHCLSLSRYFVINLIALKILHPLFEKCGVVARKIRCDEKSGYYYMSMSKRHLRENRITVVTSTTCKLCKASMGSLET